MVWGFNTRAGDSLDIGIHASIGGLYCMRLPPVGCRTCEYNSRCSVWLFYTAFSFEFVTCIAKDKEGRTIDVDI